MPETKSEYWRLVIKRFFGIFIPLVLTAVILLGYVYYTDYGFIVSSFKSSENIHNEVQKRYSENYITQAIRDLVFLSEHIEDVYRDGASFEYIESELEIFLKNNYIYDHARVLSPDGLEMIRVNVEDGKPIFVDKEALQDKSERYYIQDLSNISKDEIYMSPLDLNIEDGEIEIPYVSVIRFGVGIYDVDDELMGYVLFNLKGEEYYSASLIDDLETSHGAYVIDSNGYWIEGPSDEVEWGSLIEERKDETFDRLYPEVWGEIHSMGDGQIVNPQGIFTFHKVNLLDQANSVFNDLIVVGSEGRDYGVMTLDVVSRDIILSRTEPLLNTLLFVLLVSVIFSGLLSYLIVSVRVKKQILTKELELFRRMLDSTLDGIFIVSGTTSRILTVNKRVLDNLGYSLEELREMNLNEINTELKNENDWNVLVNQIEKKGTIQAEGRFRRKDGSEFPTEINLGVSTVGGKEYIVQVVRDITKRKESEIKILELNEILRILNKILRHDLLNDITVVRANIGLLPDEVKTMEEMIDASSALDRSQDLIKKMKEMEMAITSGEELKELNVVEVVNEVIKEFSDMKIEITGEGRILGDEAFSSVVGNFFRNAKMHGLTENVKVSIVSKEDVVTISFADDGKGVPDEVKKQLFNEGAKFGETGNTGLGLYIIRKTIERYGGKVWVEDNEPKGAIFVVQVPRA